VAEHDAVGFGRKRFQVGVRAPMHSCLNAAPRGRREGQHHATYRKATETVMVPRKLTEMIGETK